MPMDHSGKRNVALLARHVKNDGVRNVMCIYQTTDGKTQWFRNNLSPEAALMYCHHLQNICVQDALDD